MPGPVPKRSSERIRRNKENDVEVISLAGPVNQPKLGIEDPHYLVKRLWKSAAESRPGSILRTFGLGNSRVCPPFRRPAT